MVLKLYPEEAPLRASVPALTVVVPDRLIPPLAVNVPALILVKLPLLPGDRSRISEIKRICIHCQRVAAPDRYGAPHAGYRCSELQFRVPRHSNTSAALTQRRIGIDVDRPRRS